MAFRLVSGWVHRMMVTNAINDIAMIINGMKRIGIFFFAVLAHCQTVWAQQTAQKLFALPGPERTLLYVQGMTAQGQETGKTAGFPGESDRFTIYRADGDSDDFRQIGTTGFPASGADLKRRLDPVLLTDVLNQLRVQSPQEARDLLLREGPDTLGLLVLVPELQQALGFTYIDESRDAKTASRYRVEYGQEGEAPKATETISVSGTTPEYPEKFALKTYQVLDSAVAATWQCASMTYDGLPLFATIFKREGHEGEFRAVDQQLVVANEQVAGLQVNFSERILPATHLAYYIQLEDLAGNKGVVSDTLYAFGYAYGRIAGISNLQVRDTLDGLLLSWDPLPREAVYSGIQLLKSRELGADYVVVDTIPATETHYFDEQVIPASSYYYKVRPLTYDFSGAQPVSFAEANGYTAVDSLGRPLAPSGLQAVSAAGNVLLSWQHSDELDLFGYYVLRGTSSENLEIISQPVKDTVFIDSLIDPGFSGQLHYALQSVNLSQQYSDTSQVVSTAIAQPVVLTPPGGLQTRRTVDGVALQWDHVMERDEQVTGYVVYRRQPNEAFFQPVNGGAMVLLPFSTDSSASSAAPYEYAVTAVDAWGNQSILSPVSAVDADTSSGLVPPSQLYLRNLTAGIEIAWPLPVAVDGQSYLVYRRVAGQPELKLIGQADPMGVYLDNDVKMDVLYEYAVGVGTLNQTAGSRHGLLQSIRRQ